MPTVFSMALPTLWLVRAVALAAVITSGWLTILKWLNPRLSLSGCGGSEDCTALLGSRWANWFSIPVTLLAATLWLAVLLLTLPAAGRWLGRTADQLLAACAVLLVAGAVWFGALMVGVVKIWCPWCAALHLAALGVGSLLLWRTWKATRQGELGLFSAAGQTGVAGVALLILGQLFGRAPDTHVVTLEPAVAQLPVQAAVSPVLAAAKAGLPRGTIGYLDGSLLFSRQDVPSIGPVDALHVLASFADYTCSACRAQHSDLTALLKAFPTTYAVLILPTPLDRACNPHLPPKTREHQGACELASLALALWKAAPDQFPVFHDYLMTGPLPPSPASARAEAQRLAAPSTMDEQAPWIVRRLTANSNAWHQLSADNHKLPKLVLRDDIVLHGSTSSRERFFEIIGETFAAQPDTSDPVIPVSAVSPR